MMIYDWFNFDRGIIGYKGLKEIQIHKLIQTLNGKPSLGSASNLDKKDKTTNTKKELITRRYKVI